MKTKLLGILSIMLGVFLFAGVASAADADVLQPAGGTTFVESLRVGIAGEGGVTFFNGTVLNEGTEPFTVGDDFRVDGEMYRIQKGEDPIKISDNVIPTSTNINNFGDSSHRWKNIFAKNANLSGNLMPASDASSNIGSADKRWKKGYFSDEVKVGNSIIIDGNTIKSSDADINVLNTTNIGFYHPTIDPDTPENWIGEFKVESNDLILATNWGYGVTINADDVVEINPRIKLGNLYTAAVPTGDASTEGEIHYNTQTNHFFGCDGSNWKQLD